MPPNMRPSLFVFTFEAGVVLAWLVGDDGTLREMDIEEALRREENAE